MAAQPQKILDRLRDVLRLKHYAYRTEQSYVDWVYRFIIFHNKRHPKDMGVPEIEAFLTHLAVQRKVAAPTQNQALSALIFLYRHVLHQEIGEIHAVRAKQSRYLPTVLTHAEAIAVLNQLSGVHQIVAKLLYGSGLRLSEALRLRVKEIDFAQAQLVVRDGKGGNSRITMLPASIVDPLQDHLHHVRRQHQQDLAQGYGSVYLPYALERKYPNADRQWIWQYVFPSERISQDPRSSVVRRHHLDESGLQKAVKQAAFSAKIDKRVSCHTFRHSFATQLLQNHYDIRTVQELLGHKDVKTTMIYTHVLNKGGRGVLSPLDTCA
ncbi:MAG: integron integrase [Acaryochloridaceae cyanobacterium RU_4_10]|nr:integron integrase [Acaryochloridaceae cyanobacterium RU_4_10]